MKINKTTALTAMLIAITTNTIIESSRITNSERRINQLNQEIKSLDREITKEENCELYYSPEPGLRIPTNYCDKKNFLTNKWLDAKHQLSKEENNLYDAQKKLRFYFF